MNLWSKLAKTSVYFLLLKRKFLRICPYGEKELNVLIRQTIWKVEIVSIFVIVVLVLWNGFFHTGVSLYFLGSIFLGLYLVAMEVPNYIVQEKENKLYQDLLVYFSKVKHQYLSCHHIPNAIYNAAETMNYEVQQHAKKMYQILMSGNRKESIREYVLFFNCNRYLKLFLVQAYEASEKGDLLLRREESLFSDNVEYLRLELMEELYRRRKRAYEFSGYIFVTVTPFFMMPILKQWGLDFAPELEFFYAGTGKLIELITFFASIVLYGFINRAKEITLFLEPSSERKEKQNKFYRIGVIQRLIGKLEQQQGTFSIKIRELLLQSGIRTSYGYFVFQMIAITVISFLLLVGFMCGIHEKEKQSIVTTVNTLDMIMPVASEEKKQLMKEQIILIVKQYKEKENITEEEIKEVFRNRVYLSNQTMEQEIIAMITGKIIQYQQVKMVAWEWLFCFLGSIVAGMIPFFKVWYQVQTALSGTIYEIRQFQSVIIMERRLHGITLLGILEDMESFSQVFKSVLQKCINSYPSGPNKALQEMKKEGGKLHSSFEELADGFLSVDEVGIEKAFAEVEHNRVLLEKMSQLEAEINLEKKKDSTELLTKIPIFLTVGVYFIIPFFLFSMYGVFEVFTLLEELQR